MLLFLNIQYTEKEKKLTINLKFDQTGIQIITGQIHENMNIKRHRIT